MEPTPPPRPPRRRGGCCGGGAGAVEPTPAAPPPAPLAEVPHERTPGEPSQATKRARRTQVRASGAPSGASPSLGPAADGSGKRHSKRDDEWWRGRTLGSRESSLKSLYQQVSAAKQQSASDLATSNRLQMAASGTADGVKLTTGTSTELSEPEVVSELADEVSAPLGVARVYGHVNDDYPVSHFDTTREPMDWGQMSTYNIRRDKLIGQGAYGEVFLATAPSGADVVVKLIKSTPDTLVKIQKEVMMLRLVQAGPHIVRFLGMVADPADDARGLVFEFLHNPNYKESFRRMSDLDARWYLFRVLDALDFTHSLGVMHRDVKGGNVLYDPKTKQVRLIDWGFAEFYRPTKPQASWPGTRPYKAPELFLHYPYYDYSVDVWAFACLMASLIFRRTLFRSDDNFHQMELIGRLLGTTDYARYLRKYSNAPHCVDSKKYRFIGDRNTERVGLTSFASPKAPLASPEAIAVVDSVLMWDHEKRPTARDLMNHTYFDVVRNFKGKRALS